MVGGYPAAVLARRTSLVAALLAALAVAGCGADQEGPSPDKQVRDVVQRFGAASASKDYQTICDRLLSRKLVQNVEQVGLPCESVLQRGLGDVQAPRLEIRQVQVSGARALVSVHSTAAGQPPSDDALQLAREDGEWRIASLAAPRPPASSTTATPTTATATTPAPTTTTTTSGG
jgi:hypothetical protein